jgi:hypothetical protein
MTRRKTHLEKTQKPKYERAWTKVENKAIIPDFPNPEPMIQYDTDLSPSRDDMPTLGNTMRDIATSVFSGMQKVASGSTELQKTLKSRGFTQDNLMDSNWEDKFMPPRF